MVMSRKQQRAMFAKLGSIGRVRATLVFKKTNKNLDGELKKVSTKRQVNIIRLRKKKNDEFIKTLRANKPISTKKLRIISSELNSIINENADEGDVIGTVKADFAQTSVNTVINKRVRGVQ